MLKSNYFLYSDFLHCLLYAYYITQIFQDIFKKKLLGRYFDLGYTPLILL